MFVRVRSRWRGAARWSRDRANNILRRVLKPRLYGFAFYIFLVLIFFISMCSFMPSSSQFLSKEKSSDSTEGSDPKAKHVLKREYPPVVNRHNYHVMISNPRLCADLEEVHLLIMVASSASNFERRHAIRSTWGKSEHLLPHQARLLFLLANPKDTQIQRKIVEEYRSYGDTMQEDFLDSYLNLTLKSVMGLKWAASHCSKASFVMKTDDDIFVNVPLLVNYLKEIETEGVFIGCIKQKNAFKPVNVDANSMLPPVHPLFAAGAGYVFSGSLLQKLFDASLRTRIVPVEDVYVTGHLAKIVNAHPPWHDNRFSCGEMVLKDCHMAKTFTGHKITPERMYRLWRFLQTNKNTSSCY